MKFYILKKFNEINQYFALSDNIEEILNKGYLKDAFVLCKPKEALVYSGGTPTDSIDLEKAKIKGISVSRSNIPGSRRAGVVYVSGSTWTLRWIFSGDQKDCIQKEQVFKEIIKEFYKNLGIEINPIIQDVEVKGTDKKLGMYSFKYVSDKKFCYGGITFNLKKIRQDLNDFVNIPEFKFANKSVKTIQERIITIPEVISRELSDEEFLERLEKVMKNLGLEYQKKTDLPEEVWKIISKSSVKFKSQEWIKYGRWSPVKDYWRSK